MAMNKFQQELAASAAAKLKSLQQELPDPTEEPVEELIGDPMPDLPSSEEVALKVEQIRLQEEKNRLTSILEQDDTVSAIRQAMARGRERLDPRKESESLREGGRIPFSARRYKLQVVGYDDQLDGYVPRFFKDEDIPRALEAGYLPVLKDGHGKLGSAEDGNDDLGTWVSRLVGKHENGRPRRDYLLKLRKDLYDEDQAAKRVRREETMSMTRNVSAGLSGQDAKNRYGTINIER